jgi:hypothetical protein
LGDFQNPFALVTRGKGAAIASDAGYEVVYFINIRLIKIEIWIVPKLFLLVLWPQETKGAIPYPV